MQFKYDVVVYAGGGDFLEGITRNVIGYFLSSNQAVKLPAGFPVFLSKFYTQD